MAYDRDSFLAGVAAGRNMMSWPAMDEAGTSVFAFTVQTSDANTAYRFYLTASAGGSCKILWGDGQFITQYWENNTPAIMSHTYSLPGRYRIQIFGPIDLVVDDSPALLYSIDTIIPFPSTNRESSVFDAFSVPALGGENVVYVPPGVFTEYARRGAQVKSVQYMFSGSRHLNALPDGLFSGLTITEEMSMLFAGCSFANIPANIFADTDVSRVKTAINMFSGMDNLRIIPPGILDGFLSLRNARNMFYYCTNLQSVPDDLFSKCSSITDFRNAFSFCSGITSSVPRLWETHPNANGQECFTGCVNAANWNEIPASWGGPA